MKEQIMDCLRKLVFLYLIPVNVLSKEASLRVGQNIEVKFGDEVSLDCFGSNPSLSYYIKNKFRWSHIANNGSIIHITDGFYLDMSVKNMFSTGHYSLDYETETRNQEFRYRLNISAVEHADDGTYICSLLGTNIENGVTRYSIIDQKQLKVIVLNPVASINLRLNDIPGASSVDPVNQSDNYIDVQEGQHKVSCRATGSNPAPVMRLLYNKYPLDVVPKFTFNLIKNQIKYIGYINALVEVNSSLGSEQVLDCFANVPNSQFPWKEAALKLNVEIEKPDIVCNSLTSEDSKGIIELVCNITMLSDHLELFCADVFWVLAHKQILISSNISVLDGEMGEKMFESNCHATEDGLKASLTIFRKDDESVENKYFIQYGKGDRLQRHPIYVDRMHVSKADKSKPLFLSIIIALVIINCAANDDV